MDDISEKQVRQALKLYLEGTRRAYSYIDNVRETINDDMFEYYYNTLENWIHIAENQVLIFRNASESQEVLIMETLFKKHYEPDMLDIVVERIESRVQDGFYGVSSQNVGENLKKKLSKEIHLQYSEICKLGCPQPNHDISLIRDIIWFKLADTHDDLLNEKKKLLHERIRFLNSKNSDTIDTSSDRSYV